MTALIRILFITVQSLVILNHKFFSKNLLKCDLKKVIYDSCSYVLILLSIMSITDSQLLAQLPYKFITNLFIN